MRTKPMLLPAVRRLSLVAFWALLLSAGGALATAPTTNAILPPDPETLPENQPHPPPGLKPGAPINPVRTGELIVNSAPDPGAATGTTAEANALIADKMATAKRPKSFLYTIIRDALVDEVTQTVLYLRKEKRAKHTRAVPIPKDRKLLATCITGGTVEDLVRGARVTAKFDPQGVVRPQIVIVTKVSIEVLDNAVVLDRGGAKLYVVTAEKKRRGFQIEGDAAGWNDVVQNGNADGLLVGAKIRLEFDPSGREPLKIIILTPAMGADKADEKGKGCGCSAHGPRTGAGLDLGPIALLLVLAGLWLRRRSATV